MLDSYLTVYERMDWSVSNSAAPGRRLAPRQGRSSACFLDPFQRSCYALHSIGEASVCSTRRHAKE